MAIEFSQAQKKQRRLFLILIAALGGILLIIWFGFLNRRPAEESRVPVSPPAASSTIEINWEVLKDPNLEKLQTFRPATTTTMEKSGRPNPFIPY